MEEQGKETYWQLRDRVVKEVTDVTVRIASSGMPPDGRADVAAALWAVAGQLRLIRALGEEILVRVEAEEKEDASVA